MKKLVIDIGNTIAKSAEILEEEVGELSYWDNPNELSDYINKSGFDRIGISSVVSRENEILEHISSEIDVLTLTSQTPLPIKLHYNTKETLGVDRIAGVCGAFDLFPGKDCLVIDIGTCITCDFLDKEGLYHGGVISPGLDIRLKGMHQYTGKLPLIEMKEISGDISIVGKSTFDCMKSGAYNGILMELSGFIDHFSEKYQGINIIMTGGDSYRFESLINRPIFVVPKLVLQGLNCILNYNEEL